MTIVEVVVASFLFVLVAVSTFSVVDTSTRTTFRAEETQTVINIAQRELELLREYDYGELAMRGLPAYSSDSSLPTSRIRETTKYCLDRVDADDPCPAAAAADLVYDSSPLEEGGSVTGGQVDPVSANVQVGDVTVDIYRFVVWRDEGNELRSPGSALCQAKPLHFLCKTQDYKRVVVAVRTQKAPISHQRPYEEVQSDFIDPDRATLDAEPLGPGGGEVVTGQQFYLSDTRCAAGLDEPVRALAENHQSHDTTGSTCIQPDVAPDALLSDPPDPATPLVDYSTELEPDGPTCQPQTINCDPNDRGLQMLDQGGPCAPAPTGIDAPRQIHRWVSAPMATGFDFVMTDRATLELWTRTINLVEGATGQVCAFLFKRDAAGIDTVLMTSSHSDPTWPSGPPWSQVSLTFQLDGLTLAQRTILSTERLGVSIGVDPSGTPDNVLQFLYDHPEGESRLEVLTTTPLP